MTGTPNNILILSSGFKYPNNGCALVYKYHPKDKGYKKIADLYYENTSCMNPVIFDSSGNTPNVYVKQGKYLIEIYNEKGMSKENMTKVIKDIC